MRKLGQELGVEAMSLYNHVKNKDEVLDGIVEAVVREVELPSDETDWKAALRQNAISAPRGADAPPVGGKPLVAAGGRARTGCAGPSSCSARSARPASPRT